MNWYFTLRGSHVHVRVFLNGAKCGDLVFRKEEFDLITECIFNIRNLHHPDMKGKPLITIIPESNPHDQ